MTRHTINVTYPGGNYPLYIGNSLFNEKEILTAHIKGRQVMLISNDTVAPLYLQKIMNLLDAYQCDYLLLPDGECYKNLEQFSKILDALIEKKHHRDTTLIALGGGVVGDMVGFAAACFHRGVAFIQIPTTLLSQVDASIGGKTAINHPYGKNLIGAFHQPQAVMIDISMLSTLPAREYQSGIAEIIKAALIRDENFFNYLEKSIDDLMARDTEILLETIARACTIKRDIVAIDEKEQNVRALLNLGHTFGHAIEQNQGYSQWLHGEAVAVGMVLAAALSQHLGWLAKEDLARITHLLQKAQLPTVLPKDSDPKQLITAMYADKKILGGRLRLVLLKSIGNAVITAEVSDEQIQRLIAE